jgi:hypothetical protein
MKTVPSWQPPVPLTRTETLAPYHSMEGPRHDVVTRQGHGERTGSEMEQAPGKEMIRENFPYRKSPVLLVDALCWSLGVVHGCLGGSGGLAADVSMSGSEISGCKSHVLLSFPVRAKRYTKSRWILRRFDRDI